MASSQLDQDEYVDEGNQSMHIVEPLGSFTRRRRYNDKSGMLVDEIMEVDVSRETLIETESQIKKRMSDFTDKFGVKFDKS